MKKLYSSSNKQEVELLLRYLQRSGIPVTAAERGAVIDILLIQPDYEALAREHIAHFQANPPAAESLPLRRNKGLPLWRMLAQQAGVITFVVFLAVLITALMQWLIAPQATLSALLYNAPGSIEGIPLSQPWRLITPMLLHFSATHLVFNLFWWWYLGGRLELYYGSVMLGTVTLITAVASNYAQWLSSGANFGGLSGVAYGLIGFSLLVSWKKPHHPLSLPPFLYVFMVGFLLMGYTNVFWVNTANEAHLVGLLSGMLVGAVVRQRKPI